MGCYRLVGGGATRSSKGHLHGPSAWSLKGGVSYAGWEGDSARALTHLHAFMQGISPVFPSAGAAPWFSNLYPPGLGVPRPMAGA